MKTAMQQLIDFLEPELKMHDFLQLPAYEKAKQLLQLEEQQIKDSYSFAESVAYANTIYSAEEYFNDIFKTITP